jgi:anti-anti-sigma factor
MEVHIVKDTALVVRAHGEIDIANAGELGSMLDSAAEESPGGFVVDLSDVSYIDVTGTRAILAAYQRVRWGGGRLEVVTSGIVKRVFCLLGLDGLPRFGIRDDVEAAAAAVTSARDVEYGR